MIVGESEGHIVCYQRIISVLITIVMIFSKATPVFAAQIEEVNYETSAFRVALESERELPVERIPEIQSRGTSAPSTDWDLGSHDYTIQFITSVAIFSNVNFKNHNGEFYINLTCTSDVDQAMYVQLYEEGSSKVAAEVTIDTDGAWKVHFYNLNTSKAYYLRFIKIDDGVSVYGHGTVHL